MDIGRRLKELREKYGFSSQDSLGAAVGMKRGQIGNIESNRNSPSIKTLERILLKMGSNLQEFFDAEIKISKWEDDEEVSKGSKELVVKAFEVLEGGDFETAHALGSNINQFHKYVELQGKLPKKAKAG